MKKLCSLVLALALSVCLNPGCESEEGTKPDTTPPTAPANLVASPFGSTQTNLTWNASTDNVAVTGYEIHRNGVRVGTSTSTSYQDTGLTPGTQYCYTVRAYDAAGNLSAASGEACATTLQPDTTPPTAPTNLIAVPLGPTQVRLSWTASTDNVGVVGYDVYRGGTKVGSSALTTFEDTGLAAATQYCYTVKALDADGNESSASEQTCTATLPQQQDRVASGTYDYNATASTLTLDVLTSTFVCNGPPLGATVFTDVSVTATELAFTDPGGGRISFSRPSGTAGNIVGTWTFESDEGGTYELIVRADLTFTLYGRDLRSCFADAWSQHWEYGYDVTLSFQDPEQRATSVKVSGPGISGLVDLCREGDRWNNWSPPCEKVLFGATPPTPPLTYVFTITEPGRVWTEAATVTCFVTQRPTGLTPTGEVSGQLTFRWTRINQTGMYYQIQLHQQQGGWVWESDRLLDASSVAYDGAPLPPGAYSYFLAVSHRTGGCMSFGRGEFTYSAGR